MNELGILHLMSQNSGPLNSKCGNVGECPLCLKKYLHATSLYKHIRAKHGDMIFPSFRCWICNTVFKDQKSYDAHIGQHSEKTDVKCENCPLKYFGTYEYIKHIVRVHSEKNSCIKCGDAFGSKNELKKHLSSLTCTSFTDELKQKHVDFEEFAKENVESKSCDDYQKHATKYSSEGQACIHKRTIPFRCKHCGKSFGNSGNLKQHILSIHNGIKRKSKEIPVSCEKCDHISKNRKSLASHLMTAHGVKPFSCSHCQLAFTNKGNLNVHVKRWHSGNVKSLRSLKWYEERQNDMKTIKVVPGVSHMDHMSDEAPVKSDSKVSESYLCLNLRKSLFDKFLSTSTSDVNIYELKKVDTSQAKDKESSGPVTLSIITSSSIKEDLLPKDKKCNKSTVLTNEKEKPSAGSETNDSNDIMFHTLSASDGSCSVSTPLLSSAVQIAMDQAGISSTSTDILDNLIVSNSSKLQFGRVDNTYSAVNAHASCQSNIVANPSYICTQTSVINSQVNLDEKNNRFADSIDQCHNSGDSVSSNPSNSFPAEKSIKTFVINQVDSNRTESLENQPLSDQVTLTNVIAYCSNPVSEGRCLTSDSSIQYTDNNSEDLGDTLDSISIDSYAPCDQINNMNETLNLRSDISSSMTAVDNNDGFLNYEPIAFFNNVDIDDIYFNDGVRDSSQFLNTDWINNTTNQHQQVIVDATSLRTSNKEDSVGILNSSLSDTNSGCQQQVIVFNNPVVTKSDIVENGKEFSSDDLNLSGLLQADECLGTDMQTDMENGFNPLSFLNSIHSLKKSHTTVIKNISDGEITEFSSL